MWSKLGAGRLIRGVGFSMGFEGLSKGLFIIHRRGAFGVIYLIIVEGRVGGG